MFCNTGFIDNESWDEILEKAKLIDNNQIEKLKAFNIEKELNKKLQQEKLQKHLEQKIENLSKKRFIEIKNRKIEKIEDLTKFADNTNFQIKELLKELNKYLKKMDPSEQKIYINKTFPSFIKLNNKLTEKIHEFYGDKKPEENKLPNENNPKLKQKSHNHLWLNLLSLKTIIINFQQKYLNISDFNIIILNMKTKFLKFFLFLNISTNSYFSTEINNKNQKKIQNNIEDFINLKNQYLINENINPIIENINKIIDSLDGLILEANESIKNDLFNNDFIETDKNLVKFITEFNSYGYNINYNIKPNFYIKDEKLFWNDLKRQYNDLLTNIINFYGNELKQEIYITNLLKKEINNGRKLLEILKKKHDKKFICEFLETNENLENILNKNLYYDLRIKKEIETFLKNFYDYSEDFIDILKSKVNISNDFIEYLDENYELILNSLNKKEEFINSKNDFSLEKVYNNIYFFILNKILTNNKNINSVVVNQLILNSFNKNNIKKIQNNIFATDFEYDSLLYETLNKLEIDNLSISKENNKILINWDFENSKELFQNITIDFNENVKEILIENNGGGNIIIPHENMNFYTRGNCYSHTIVNYIINILFTIDHSKIINNENKNFLLANILNSIIDSVRSIYKNSTYADSYNEKYTKEELLEILHINKFIEKLNVNISNIIKNPINKNNKELINFIIDLYDIIVLLVKGKYSFIKKEETIVVKNNCAYSNFDDIFNKSGFNLEWLLINNIDKNQKPLFGNFYTQPFHCENTIYIHKKDFNEYINILQELNKERPDERSDKIFNKNEANEERTFDTFYRDNKII